MRFAFLRRLKAPAILIGLVALAAFGVLGSLRWPLPADAIAHRLRLALERNTGYVVTEIGETSFSALPWPSIQVADLALRKPSSPHERVEASLLKARLNVASWLFGEPKLVAVTLFDPSVHLVSSEDIGETEAVSTALYNFLTLERRPEWRTLRIERGTIHLDGEPWMTEFRLNVGHTGADSLRLEAAGRYRGEPVEVAGEAAQGARRRAIRWAVTARSFEASFRGELFGPRSLDAEGRIALSIRDGSGLAQRLNLADAHAPLLDGLKLSGETRVAWPQVQIREAVIERGDERLDGSVEMSVDARRPALAATLDAERFDLSPLLRPMSGKLLNRREQWSEAPLATSWLGAAAIDVRLSAGRLALGSLAVDQAAFSAQLGGGRLDVSLSDGRLRGGAVKGRVTLWDASQGAVGLKAQASAERIDLGPLLDLFGAGGLRGQATGQFAVEGLGGSLAQVMAGLKGRAGLSLQNGDLAGVDLDRAAMRVSTGAVARDSRTRIASLALQLRIQDGVATLAESVLATPASRAPLEGSIDLRRRAFDLTARPGETRIKLEGPWSNPVLLPDATGRINRS